MYFYVASDLTSVEDTRKKIKKLCVSGKMPHNSSFTFNTKEYTGNGSDLLGKKGLYTFFVLDRAF